MDGDPAHGPRLRDRAAAQRLNRTRTGARLDGRACTHACALARARAFRRTPLRHSDSGLGPDVGPPHVLQEGDPPAGSPGRRRPSATRARPVRRASRARARRSCDAKRNGDLVTRGHSLGGAASLWPHRPFRLALLRAACLHGCAACTIGRSPLCSHGTIAGTRREGTMQEETPRASERSCRTRDPREPGFRSFSLEVRAPASVAREGRVRTRAVLLQALGSHSAPAARADVEQLRDPADAPW
jgi:hypothetical protein